MQLFWVDINPFSFGGINLRSADFGTLTRNNVTEYWPAREILVPIARLCTVNLEIFVRVNSFIRGLEVSRK